MCRVCGGCTASDYGGNLKGVKAADVVAFADVSAATVERVQVGGTWDAAWGGGIVPGTIVLLTGSPGGGKSTVLQQRSDDYLDVALAKGLDRWAYFLSAEQAAGEIRMALDRLSLRHTDRILGLKEFGGGGEVDESLFKSKPPCVIVVDSLTALCGKDRDAAVAIAKLYKKYAVKFHCPVFLIAHLNKDGDVAGAMTLQFDVDAVAAIWSPEGHDPGCYQTHITGRDFRKLEIFKHRSGPTKRAFWYEMTENGLLDVPADYEPAWRRDNGDEDDAPPPPPPPPPKRKATPSVPPVPSRPSLKTLDTIVYNGQTLIRKPKPSRAAAVEGEAVKKKRAPMPKKGAK
jgi:predicted ATP-dependent serine protease